MKFGSIDGAVTTEGFKKWIECNSFQFNVARQIGTAARGSRNREASEPHFGEVQITKYFDISSPKQIEDAWGGDLSTTVKFKFTTTAKNKVDTFLEFELKNCGVSTYLVSAGDQGNPMESYTLNYTKIEISHTGLDTKIGGSPTRVNYDLEVMKGS
jgi:type VI secretion system secreted protein Hcp